MGCGGSKGDATSASKKGLNAPFQLGNLKLANQVVMGPMTRMRGDPATGVPNDLMVEYYAQRASYGLILSECSQISKMSEAYPGSGGVYTDEQTEGWKKIVDAVHAKGGKIYLQIYHCGRAVISDFIGGEKPIAPSAVKAGNPHFTQAEHPEPVEMTVDQIKEVVQQFRVGAENAKKAGFDGIQLHGANGYLVDQFLRDGTNKRTDDYGGSIENRCRFMNEVLDELIAVFGANRTCIRVGPTGRFNDMYDSEPLELLKQIFKDCESKKLQFVEVKRHGALDGAAPKEEGVTTDEQGRTLPDVQIPDFYKTIRPLYKGILMGNDGFSPESALQAVQNKELDLVSFAKLAIANPDLPARIANGWEVDQTVDFPTFFQGGEKGYTDWKNYEPKKEEPKEEEKKEEAEEKKEEAEEKKEE